MFDQRVGVTSVAVNGAHLFGVLEPNLLDCHFLTGLQDVCVRTLTTESQARALVAPFLEGCCRLLGTEGNTPL